MSRAGAGFVRVLRGAVKAPAWLLINLVKGYRLLLSPSLGSACRFTPSCSAYSLQALQQHGAAAGSYLTLRRLVRCSPWCVGGHDPVPERLHFFLRQSGTTGAESRFFSRLVTPVAASFSKKRPS